MYRPNFPTSTIFYSGFVGPVIRRLPNLAGFHTVENHSLYPRNFHGWADCSDTMERTRGRLTQDAKRKRSRSQHIDLANCTLRFRSCRDQS